MVNRRNFEDVVAQVRATIGGPGGPGGGPRRGGRRAGPYTAEVREAAVAAYLAGESTTSLSALHGASPPTIRRWVRDAGGKVRRQGRPGAVRHAEPYRSLYNRCYTHNLDEDDVINHAGLVRLVGEAAAGAVLRRPAVFVAERERWWLFDDALAAVAPRLARRYEAGSAAWRADDGAVSAAHEQR